MRRLGVACINDYDGDAVIAADRNSLLHVFTRCTITAYLAQHIIYRDILVVSTPTAIAQSDLYFTNVS